MKYTVSSTERGTIRLTYETDVKRASSWIEFSITEAQRVAMAMIGLIPSYDVEEYYHDE
jgi:hypothetical protein